MRHPFFAASRPLVFAHRGGSALAPENTLAAFDNGLRLGADGLELDVHLSRDGVVVVHHDRLLDRTTTLRGPIAARTADELGRAKAIDRVCLGSFGLRVLRAARALEPRVATSAAREEVRWALYRSWCRWPVRGVAYDGYQVPEWSGSTHVLSPRFVRY